jgi:hypothetical protein
MPKCTPYTRIPGFHWPLWVLPARLSVQEDNPDLYCIGITVPGFLKSVPLAGCCLIMLFNVYARRDQTTSTGANTRRGSLSCELGSQSPSLARFPYGSCPPPHCARDVVNGSGGRRIDPKAAKRPSGQATKVGKGWIGECLAKSRKWQVAVTNGLGYRSVIFKTLSVSLSSRLFRFPIDGILHV